MSETATNIDQAQDGAEDTVLTVHLNPAAIMAEAEKGGEFVLKPEAEDAIVTLLRWQKQINDAVEFVKGAVEAAGMSYTEFFTSVQGDKVKVNVQQTGSLYAIDASAIKRYNAPFFQKKIAYALNSKAVEEFETNHNGKLPNGVLRNPKRGKSVVIRLSKDVEL